MALVSIPYCGAFAQGTDNGSDSNTTYADGRRTTSQFTRNMGRGFTGLFARENLQPFLWSAAALGISFAIEDDVRENVVEDDNGFSDFASDYLGPLVLGLGSAGVFLNGRTSDDQLYRDMSYDLGVAVANNLILTAAIKAAVDRTRPNDGNEKSFPSGHTSNAFAMASVINAHYGHRAGIPAFGVASLIGLTRIQRDAHWLTDVVAGAALGYLVGTSVVRQNSLAERKISISPSISSSFRGIVVRGEF